MSQERKGCIVCTHPLLVQDLASCGELAQYDKAADRVTPKVPAKLRRTAARTRSTTTLEDPILR